MRANGGGIAGPPPGWAASATTAAERGDAETDDAGRSPRTLSSISFGTVLAVGGPAAFLGVLGYQRRWTIDDAFIFFRVVAQIQHDHGPVFNAGERVEVATSPAWLAILTVARFVTPAGVSLEWIAVVLSLLLSVFAVVVIGVAGMRIVRFSSDARRGVVVPFGSLVIVAIPAFWDYSTSGLETALGFAWLAACFWALVGLMPAPAGPRRSVLVGVLIGLGPLVRPDFAIYSACFLGVLFYIDHGRSVLGRVAVVAALVALPFAFQVFRMGYYATLVPNTALAKEASSARWGRGIAYAKDFASAYYLFIPLLAIAVAVGVLVARLGARPRPRDWRLLVVAPIVAATLHAAYVVRLGGDYMHARMLLPALFCAMMPVAVIEIRDAANALATAAVVIWGVSCAASLRAPLVDRFVSDQRAYAIEITQRTHPVTLNDYRGSYDFVFYPTWQPPDARSLVVPQLTSYVVDSHGNHVVEGRRELPLASAVQAKHGFAFPAIGALGYALGTNVFVVDRAGLADPIGSRLSGFPSSMATGQLHDMTLPWVEARFAASNAPDPSPTVQLQREQAVDALTCGQPPRLIRDVTAPLSVSRFFGNIKDAIANTALRIPVVTVDAEREACGDP